MMVPRPFAAWTPLRRTRVSLASVQVARLASTIALVVVGTVAPSGDTVSVEVGGLDPPPLVDPPDDDVPGAEGPYTVHPDPFQVHHLLSVPKT